MSGRQKFKPKGMQEFLHSLKISNKSKVDFWELLGWKDNFTTLRLVLMAVSMNNNQIFIV